MRSWFHRNAKRLAAVAAVVTIYFFARLPSLAESERTELAARFGFTSHVLPEVAGPEERKVRPVHPDLAHVAGWISTVGASVGIADLDGDGLANDICYVDTRTDQVIVTPAPTSPSRYATFAVSLPSKNFDRRTMCPTGCVPGDLNEDGLTDLLVYFWGRPPVACLRRDNAAKLAAAEFLVREIADPAERWYTNAATRADVDGDGHVDIIVGNYFPDGARVLDVSGEGTETMHDSMSRAFNGGRNRILLFAGGSGGAKPTVTYREAEGVFEEQVARGWTLSIGAADLDDDQLPEIYFGNDFGPDRLLHNRSTPGKPRFALVAGQKTLTTPSSKVLGRDSFKGMGVDFGDVNGDGLLDIYVSNIAAEFALEESHFLWVSTGATEEMKQGRAPYVDQSESLGVSRSGWGWDSRLADFDNDGVLEAVQACGFLRGEVNRWPELHEVAMGNDELLHSPDNWHRFEPGDDLSGSDRNPFFVRAADGRFYDIAPQLNIDAGQVSRGIATADVDGDGDLDFAVANQWQESRFYRNDAPHPGAFLGLRLLVAAENAPANVSSPRLRPAIGATAVIHRGDGVRLVGQVDGGNGHSGKRSPELHFGLGSATTSEPLKVDVAWRDRHGAVRHKTFRLAPGWHTLVLDPSEKGS